MERPTAAERGARYAATRAASRDAEEMLGGLIAGMRDAPVALPDGVPDAAAARERMRAGVPALAGEPLLEDAALLDAARAVASALGAAAPARAALARETVAALERVRAHVGDGALATIALSASWTELGDWATRLALPPEPLVAIADFAARPTLRTAAARIADVLRETPWTHGRCPACGALPLLGEMRPGGGEDARVLRCGRCGSAWRHARGACPDCGERDHRMHRTLAIEGESEHRRVDACDSCGFYVKVLAVLEPLDADALLVRDLESSPLDFLAAERGLRRAERTE